MKNVNSTIEVHERFEDDPSGGFRNHVEFFQAVRSAESGRIDSRLRRFQATQGTDEQSIASDPYGGFLIPTSVAPGISVTAEQDPLAGLVTSVPMATPIVRFTARVDKDHSTSVSGGLTVARATETSTVTSSLMQLEPVELNVHDLFGLAFATNSILQDSMESFLAILQAGFSDELANKVMNERINGTGGGQFLGVLKAPCLITTSKEVGQVPATIVSENIDNMMASCWRFWKATWLANPTVRPQLKKLVRVVGTAGSSEAYLKTGDDGQERLDGRPIFYSEWNPILGTTGDLLLCNWSEYLQGQYRPLQQVTSMHVRFIANESAFKFWLRNDGTSWWRAALTPKNGGTRSPFIALQTRS
jgi:HK97 family phage major capsid protein